MKTKLLLTLSFFISFLSTDLFGFAPPTNDACVDAIELTDLENCNTVHVDISEATSSTLSGSNEPDVVDVWYKFTAITNQIRLHNIELNFYNTSSFGFEIYEAACPGEETPLIYQYTYHNHVEFTPNLTIGEVYYFRVFLTGGTKADFCIESSCTLEVVSAAPTACDPLDNTYDLEVELAYLGGTIGEDITFHIDDFQGELTFNGVDDTLSFTLSDLPASGTSTYAFLDIYNSLDRYCRADYQNLYTEPAPCVDPPANDSCHQATLISDLTTCNPIHLDMNGATVDSLHGQCDEELGVWYKFIAISDVVEIKVLDVTSYNTDGLRYDLYEGSCSSSSIVSDCKPTFYFGEKSTTVSGLIIGEEYFLRVWLAGGTKADFCIQAGCELEIISAQPLACDPSDNTYDLEIEIGGKNIAVGDSLVLNLDGGPNPTIIKYELTESTDTAVFVFPDLPSDGGMHYLFVESQGEKFCDDNTTFQAPPVCVPPPPNDSCHQATVVDLTTCNTLNVDLTGATIEANLVNPCNGAGDVDVWYKFTAVSKSVYFLTSTLNADGISYQLYVNSCSPINQIDGECSGFSTAPRGTTFDNLTIGEDYFLRVILVNGLNATICLEAQCDIEITNHSVTTCDNGDNTYDLIVDISTTGLEIGDSLVIQVADNSYRGGLKITSTSGNYTLTASGLPSTGEVVSIYILEYNGGCFNEFVDLFTTPEPCVSAPVNDDCVNATPILNSSIPDTFHVSSLGSTPSTNLTNSCFDNTSRDVWYKFTATSTRIGLKGIDFSNNNSIQEFEIYEDGCNATSRLGSCVGTCGNCYSEFEGLEIGAVYYIRFSFYQQEIEANISIENLCDFEVVSYQASPCDPATNTYDLTLEFSLTNEMIGDNIAISVNSSYITQTITSIESSYTFNVNGLPATGAPISVYLSNTTQECDEYFYQIYTAPDACVPGPSNDNCSGAINIPDLKNCNILHFNNYGASVDDFSFCQSGAIGTWYQFTANTPSIIIKGKNLNNTNSNEFLGVQAYEGTCNGLNLLDCSNGLCEDNCDFVLDDLVIGQVYYLLLHSSFIIETDFCIEALNGNICNDIPLLLDMDTTNQATYQTQQTITAEGMIPNTDNTTFIAEQSITLMPGFHAQAGAEFHAYIEDCTPPSPLVETPAEERTTAKVIPTESIPLVEDLTVAPNPFRYSTTLKYTLENTTAVNLQIYNMSGQLEKELVSHDTQQAGVYEYTFEPKADAGNFYFAVMTTPEQVITKKMIFIR